MGLSNRRAGSSPTWTASLGFLAGLFAATTGLAEEARPTGEEAPPDAFEKIAERLTISGEALALYTSYNPIRAWPNPNNSIKTIKKWDTSTEARLRIDYRDRDNGIHLRLEPWYQYEHASYGYGADRVREGGEKEFRIGRYLAAWHDALPYTTVSLQRTVVAWGPGFMLSPSNPFPISGTTDNPLSEKAGGDFWRVSTVPADNVSLLFYHNYGNGAEDNTELDPFQESWAGLIGYMGFNYSGALVVANQEDDGLMGGGYGQWTVNEAMVAWADIGYRERGRGYYPQKDASSAIGGNFVNDSDYAPEVLLGVSYTTKDDTSLYLEYLYYGAGWDGDDQDLARDLEHNAYRLQNTNPATALTQLGNAAKTNLDYLGRHLVGVTVAKTLGPVDLELNNVVNVQDWSGQLFGSAVYSIGPAKLSLSGLTTYGKRGTTFRQDLKTEVTAAALWRF